MSIEDGDVIESQEVESVEVDSVEVDSEVESEVDGEDSELSDDQAEELAEEVEQAIEDGASKKEVQALVEKFKIKVNGKEKEVELDWNNKQDIIKRLQMAEAAQEAMQSRAEIERSFKKEVSRLKQNPWEVLEELGFDPDDLAEQRIAKFIEEAQKSPEQKAQEEKDRELQELRDQLKREKEAKEQFEYEQMQQKYISDLNTEIDEAISATTDLPKSQYVRKRVADAMAWAMDQENELGEPMYPNVTAKQVMPIVEKELSKELGEFLDEMPDKVLEKFMSKKVSDRLRNQRLSKMPAKKKILDTGKTEDKPVERKKQSLLDFQRNGFKK